ncbi:unnamed protein product [Clavelina lepadiformis]|uniref:Uncharacterized protein n=2 Tax=Clavelina lepadiformis TaxID=159417 RepID=A0ABP0F6U9_CLALP
MARKMSIFSVSFVLYLPYAISTYTSTVGEIGFVDDVVNIPESYSCSGVCQCQKQKFYFDKSRWTSYEFSGALLLTTICENENLPEIPNDIGRNTQALILNNNRINALHSAITGKNAFASFSGIVILSIQRNELLEIEISYFKDYVGLKALILSNNLLNNMNWTEGLMNSTLAYLDMSRNLLRKVKASNFELPSLLGLDLNHNYIELIEPSAFQAYPNLEFLDLSHNAISRSTLYKDSLRGMPALQWLSLASNFYAFSQVPDLAKLGIEPRSVKSLNFHGLKMITSIGYAAFRGMTDLQELNLSSCNIETLAQGWLNGGPYKTLKTLDLSRNRIKRFESGTLVGIYTGDYEYQSTENDLVSSPASLPYIVSPSVGDTGLATKDISYATFQDAITFKFDPLFYLPLDSLQWLSLENNPDLESIDDDVFRYLPNLKFLFLQMCNITKLLIATTEYRYQSGAIKSTLPYLEGLWAYGNPLYCDCHIRAVKYALHWEPNNNSLCSNSCDGLENCLRLDGESYFYEDRCYSVEVDQKTVCFLPQSGQKFLVDSVSNFYLTCTEEPLSLFISMLIGPLTFAVSIVIVMICGWCSVMIRRIHRLRSGLYDLMDEQRVYKERVNSKNEALLRRRKPQKLHRQNGSASLFSMSPRTMNKTNMVLSGMGGIRTNNTNRIPYCNSIQSWNLPRSSSPNPANGQRTNKLGKKAEKRERQVIKLYEIKPIRKNVEQNNVLSSVSCPNIYDRNGIGQHYDCQMNNSKANTETCCSLERIGTMPYIDESDTGDAEQAGQAQVVHKPNSMVDQDASEIQSFSFDVKTFLGGNRSPKRSFREKKTRSNSGSKPLLTESCDLNGTNSDCSL